MPFDRYSEELFENDNPDNKPGPEVAGDGQQPVYELAELLYVYQSTPFDLYGTPPLKNERRVIATVSVSSWNGDSFCCE